MNDFLTSNEWQWRLLRTIAQGVLGVVVALVMAVLSQLMAEIGKAGGEGAPVLERGEGDE